MVSQGTETYYYTAGPTNGVVVNGSGGGLSIKTQTADWVNHDPATTNTPAGTNGTATQRVPFRPAASQPVEVWIKSGYQFQIDKCFIYYTTDGSNPEGATLCLHLLTASVINWSIAERLGFLQLFSASGANVAQR